MSMRTLTVAAVLATLAGTAIAQPNQITNSSFEDNNIVPPPPPSTMPPRDSNTQANGWYRFNDGSTATTAFARTGSRSMKLAFGATGDFEGAWNGARFNDDPNPDRRRPFAPLIRYKAGPVTVGGWYLIPDATPITDPGWISPKLEVFTAVPFNPMDPGDPLFLQGFEYPDQIFGSTGGQWVQFQRTLQNSDFISNSNTPAPGADIQVRFLVIMFRPGGGLPPVPDASYWDDVELRQSITLGCAANCDGSTTAPVLNALDFSCFLNRFRAGCP